MGSIDAKKVALEVLEKLGKEEKINLGEIARKNGYAQNTSDNPKFITETKTYKETIAPFVKRMERERDRLISAIELKDLDELAYDKAIDAIDKLTKNIQLLSGGETERQTINVDISEDIAKRYALTPNAETDSTRQTPIQSDTVREKMGEDDGSK